MQIYYVLLRILLISLFGGGGGVSCSSDFNTGDLEGTTTTLHSTHTLTEELEGALLGNVSHTLECLDRLLAEVVLTTADDAAGLSLHEVLLV